MTNKKVILSMVLSISIGICLHAQQGVVSSGCNAYGTGGSVSYSIGQVVCSSAYGTTGTVNQGIQQPYELCPCGVGVKGAECINLNYLAYPNPTIDYLTLSIGNYRTENLFYQLIDINDRLLENQKIKSNLSSIFLGNYLPATYFLKIVDNNNDIKTFKIIKR